DSPCAAEKTANDHCAHATKQISYTTVSGNRSSGSTAAYSRPRGRYGGISDSHISYCKRSQKDMPKLAGGRNRDLPAGHYQCPDVRLGLAHLFQYREPNPQDQRRRKRISVESGGKSRIQNSIFERNLSGRR